MSVQLFTPKFRIDECLTEIRECLEKGWTGLGYKTLAFEDAWREYSGHAHAHFLSSNTVGLHLALEILKDENDWADDDEVITTPLTFVSTNHAILHSRLKPVFADVDEHLCLDPVSVLNRLSPKTRAIVFVGMGGNIGQYEAIAKLCENKNVKLILDAAHMAGTRVGGNHVGLDADVAVYSFQAVKNLPTADSGMICFKETSLDERVRKLTWLGINKDTYARTASQGAYKWMYEVEEVGYKYHGNSIMASLGLVALRYLDQDNAYRRQMAAWYRQRLERVPSIKVVPVAPGCESSTHLLQVCVQNRDSVMLALNKSEIYPGVHYRDNTEYHMYAYARGTCPKAARASAEVISLPMHMGLSKVDIDYVADHLIDCLTT
jgi:dTDP-4-amino-4,6-dideoxygalactose transaminase